MASKKEQLSTDLAKFVEQSQWAKAVTCLQGLVELEPANANYYLRMGDYSVKAGNKPAAVKAYYRAAKLFVDSGFSDDSFSGDSFSGQMLSAGVGSLNGSVRNVDTRPMALRSIFTSLARERRG